MSDFASRFLLLALFNRDKEKQNANSKRQIAFYKFKPILTADSHE